MIRPLNSKASTPDCRRRGRQDIVMQILKLARTGIKKTRLMYEANLSFAAAGKYLDALEKANLIAKESDMWETTEKGLHVIEACEICQHLMKKAE